MAKLKRDLSLFEATMYGVGLILGAGIYALIGEAAGLAGNAVWLSFTIAALIAALTGLSYAELSSMFPKEAAEYIYNKKAFKKESFSFMIGWTLIAANIIAVAAVAIGFGHYFSSLFGTNFIVAAVVLILLAGFVNFLGISESVKLNVIFTLIELSGLLLIIFFGIPYLGSVDYTLSVNGAPGIISAAALIFFAYIGFENIANVSEETKEAIKTVPRALILSLIITTALYILVAFSAVSVLGYEGLGSSSAPFTAVAQTAMGSGGAILLSVIALFATGNTVLILLIVVSRLTYGMASDGALPKKLSTIHKKRRTPWIAIILTTILCALTTLSGNISAVGFLTDVGIFIAFISINAALITLRYKSPKLKRPFKYPVNIGKMPVLALIGLLVCIFMLFNFPVYILGYEALILLSGFIVHRLIKRL